jgi:hypothetical protein
MSKKDSRVTQVPQQQRQKLYQKAPDDNAQKPAQSPYQADTYNRYQERGPSQSQFDMFQTDDGEEQRLIQEKATRDASAQKKQSDADFWGNMATGAGTVIGGIGGAIAGGIGGAAAGGVGAIPGAIGGAGIGSTIGGGLGGLAGSAIRKGGQTDPAVMAAQDEELKRLQLKKEREQSIMQAIALLGR